jgi:hypothetical protein
MGRTGKDGLSTPISMSATKSLHAGTTTHTSTSAHMKSWVVPEPAHGNEQPVLDGAKTSDLCPTCHKVGSHTWAKQANIIHICMLLLLSLQVRTTRVISFLRVRTD